MRRLFVGGFVLLAIALGSAAALGQRSQPTVVEVFKTPTCGCCSLWVEHL
jgi:hypothetical protein